MPVAAEVARHLGVDLDVIVVRKLGLPDRPEVAMGALGEGGVKVVDDQLVRRAAVSPTALAQVEEREQRELVRRASEFRRAHPRVSLDDRVVIVIDDGLATGATARAACAVARAAGAGVVILAVPVAPVGWESTMGRAADMYVAASTPTSMRAVGAHYDDFSQTTDEEVLRCLASVRRRTD